MEAKVEMLKKELRAEAEAEARLKANKAKEIHTVGRLGGRGNRREVRR